MTKEELIKKIYAEIAKLSDNASQMCEEYEGYRLACQDISDVLHEITKEIQPSLPSDIDETAKSCLKEALQKFYDTIGKPYALVNESEVDEFGEFLFRAGAVWMAGQGVSIDGKVIMDFTNPADIINRRLIARAEQAALIAYPPEMIYGESTLDGKYDGNATPRYYYIKGYEQAEKDIALTVKDLELLHTFLYAVKNNKSGCFTFTRLAKEQYEEVLRRFNAQKTK